MLSEDNQLPNDAKSMKSTRKSIDSTEASDANRIQSTDSLSAAETRTGIDSYVSGHYDELVNDLLTDDLDDFDVRSEVSGKQFWMNCLQEEQSEGIISPLSNGSQKAVSPMALSPTNRVLVSPTGTGILSIVDQNTLSNSASVAVAATSSPKEGTVGRVSDISDARNTVDQNGKPVGQLSISATSEEQDEDFHLKDLGTQKWSGLISKEDLRAMQYSSSLGIGTFLSEGTMRTITEDASMSDSQSQSTQDEKMAEEVLKNYQEDDISQSTQDEQMTKEALQSYQKKEIRARPLSGRTSKDSENSLSKSSNCNKKNERTTSDQTDKLMTTSEDNSVSDQDNGCEETAIKKLESAMTSISEQSNGKNNDKPKLTVSIDESILQENDFPLQKTALPGQLGTKDTLCNGEKKKDEDPYEWAYKVWRRLGLMNKKKENVSPSKIRVLPPPLPRGNLSSTKSHVAPLQERNLPPSKIGVARNLSPSKKGVAPLQERNLSPSMICMAPDRSPSKSGEFPIQERNISPSKISMTRNLSPSKTSAASPQEENVSPSKICVARNLSPSKIRMAPLLWHPSQEEEPTFPIVKYAEDIDLVQKVKKPSSDRLSLPSDLRQRKLSDNNFANILSKWKEKSDDKPNSHFLSPRDGDLEMSWQRLHSDSASICNETTITNASKKTISSSVSSPRQQTSRMESSIALPSKERTVASSVLPKQTLSPSIAPPKQRMGASTASPKRKTAYFTSPQQRRTNSISAPNQGMAAPITSPKRRVAGSITSPKQRMALSITSPRQRTIVVPRAASPEKDYSPIVIAPRLAAIEYAQQERKKKLAEKGADSSKEMMFEPRPNFNSPETATKTQSQFTPNGEKSRITSINGTPPDTPNSNKHTPSKTSTTPTSAYMRRPMPAYDTIVEPRHHRRETRRKLYGYSGLPSIGESTLSITETSDTTSVTASVGGRLGIKANPVLKRGLVSSHAAFRSSHVYVDDLSSLPCEEIVFARVDSEDETKLTEMEQMAASVGSVKGEARESSKAEEPKHIQKESRKVEKEKKTTVVEKPNQEVVDNESSYVDAKGVSNLAGVGKELNEVMVGKELNEVVVGKESNEVNMEKESNAMDVEKEPNRSSTAEMEEPGMMVKSRGCRENDRVHFDSSGLKTQKVEQELKESNKTSNKAKESHNPEVVEGHCILRFDSSSLRAQEESNNSNESKVFHSPKIVVESDSLSFDSSGDVEKRPKAFIASNQESREFHNQRVVRRSDSLSFDSHELQEPKESNKAGKESKELRNPKVAGGNNSVSFDVSDVRSHEVEREPKGSSTAGGELNGSRNPKVAKENDSLSFDSSSVIKAESIDSMSVVSCRSSSAMNVASSLAPEPVSVSGEQDDRGDEMLQSRPSPCREQTTNSLKSVRATPEYSERPWRRDIMVRDVKTVMENVNCECSQSVFSGNDELVEFFLPLIGMPCRCGRQEKRLLHPKEPISLRNILRTWQVDFLGSFGIHRGDQLVKAHHRSAKALANALRQWRKKQGMTPFRTSSCGMALHIWSKTCKAFVRAIRKQVANGVDELECPNTLAVVSTFLEQIPARYSSPVKSGGRRNQVIHEDDCSEL